eukprot:g4876.t1
MYLTEADMDGAPSYMPSDGLKMIPGTDSKRVEHAHTLDFLASRLRGPETPVTLWMIGSLGIPDKEKYKYAKEAYGRIFEGQLAERYGLRLDDQHKFMTIMTMLWGHMAVSFAADQDKPPTIFGLDDRGVKNDYSEFLAAYLGGQRVFEIRIPAAIVTQEEADRIRSQVVYHTQHSRAAKTQDMGIEVTVQDPTLGEFQWETPTGDVNQAMFTRKAHPGVVPVNCIGYMQRILNFLFRALPTLEDGAKKADSLFADRATRHDAGIFVSSVVQALPSFEPARNLNIYRLTHVTEAVVAAYKAAGLKGSAGSKGGTLSDKGKKVEVGGSFLIIDAGPKHGGKLLRFVGP